MVPKPLEVDEFEWDDENMVHCGLHDFGPRIAEQVRSRLPLYFKNKAGRRATYVMVGPDRSGRSWTIAIQNTDSRGRWRPITGWLSSPQEVEQYYRTIGR